MSVYKRGKVYWYKFAFNGQIVRESSMSNSKTVAKAAERQRRREMEEGFNGLGRPQRAQIFSVAAEAWLRSKTPHLSPRTVAIEEANLRHLKPVFGRTLLCDISAEDVGRYQQARLKEGAAAKTINLELGTFRAILRKNRLWANLQPDVKMLRTREDTGRAISKDEETALLEACLASRSRSLYPAVVLALSTCMRYSEIRLLKWGQVDFVGKTIQVGDSKTEAGTGRVIPLNDRACKVLTMWAANFPTRKPEHYAFPAERYGAAGDDFTPRAYHTDPTRPIGDWKEAWEAARKRAGAILKGLPVATGHGSPKRRRAMPKAQSELPKDQTEKPEPLRCRFHDLRHTGCTRMLEAGVPLSVVAVLMGWSATATVRMAKRYGHIGQAAQREAVAALNGADFEGERAQIRAQSQTVQTSQRPN